MHHLYPNLELAQAKSSLKYRIQAARDELERPRSPELAARDSSPPRRHHHVPALSHAQSVAFFDGGVPVQVVGRRRRRAELSPSPSPEHQVSRTVSLTLISLPGDGAAGTPVLSPTLVRRLERIDHIIACADGNPSTDANRAITANASASNPRRGSNAQRLGLMAISDNAATAGPAAETLSHMLKSAQSRRKVWFLMKQGDPDKSRGSIKDTEQLRRSGDKRASRSSAARSRPSKEGSQRQLNGERVMEFADAVNNKPRTTTTSSPDGSTISLDKQLRRISLVSFEQAAALGPEERRILERANSSLAMRRRQMFGIYSIREVMAVIRLFWFLDADRSGGITLDELHLHRDFFTQLGRTDLGAVFHELDVDGNGTVALNELLRVCFRHANDHQLQAMLTLAKVGDVHEYLTGRHSGPRSKDKETDTRALEETRKELQEIFHVFDRNGDGRINRLELLEALTIDDEIFAPALETTRGSWAENAKRMERAKTGGAHEGGHRPILRRV